MFDYIERKFLKVGHCWNRLNLQRTGKALSRRNWLKLCVISWLHTIRYMLDINDATRNYNYLINFQNFPLQYEY